MTRGRALSASAALTIVATVILALVILWGYVVNLVILLVAGRLLYGLVSARLGVRPRDRRGGGLVAAGLSAAVGYLFGRSDTHPCAQCAAPIAKPSRATYCSPACRRYSRFENAETVRQAAALEKFGDLPEGFGA